jgi:hypothetical protein
MSRFKPFFALSLLFPLLSVLVSACTHPAPVVKPAEPVVVVKPVVVPDPPVVPVKQTPIKTEPPRVAVLLSRDIGPYRELANKLVARLGERAEIFVMQGKQDEDSEVIADIETSDRKQLVAIGLGAARAAAGLNDKQVVFSYVFNYQDQKLVKPNMKGVSALPGAEKLFADWKILAPGIARVAVFTGGQMDEYVKYAGMMAAQQQIKLVHQVVHSDKEFLYRAKKLPASVQGLWIIPDYRVLSRKALKEVLTYNAKEAKQTVVFSPSLLKLGGLFYSQTSADEMAEKIYHRLRRSEGKQVVPGDDMELLRTHQMGINPVMARQLGLSIPASLRKYRYE